MKTTKSKFGALSPSLLTGSPVGLSGRLDNQSLLIDESLYSTANGYIGIRGNFEEGYGDDFETVRGSFINGYYENHSIKYSESAYGFPLTGESMVNVFDGQSIVFIIEGERFSISNGTIIDVERKLDIKKGYALRKMHWISPKGHELLFVFKRMVSFTYLELFTIDIAIKSINYNGEIEIVSTLEKPEAIENTNNDPRIAEHSIDPLIIDDIGTTNKSMYILGSTVNSRLSVQASCFHNLAMAYNVTESKISATTTLKIKEHETIRFTKYIVYTDSRRHKKVKSEGLKKLKEAVAIGIDHHYVEQSKHLKKFWHNAEITINSGDKINEALAYNMYQLYASAGKDGVSQISAKGLSGIGYEGHYFWDTEIYLIPFFTLTSPELAKTLLKFRYEIMSDAKNRAKELGHEKGAKIPWRTISGIECSSYFPAGTAQYHINADVAYAYIQYYLVTGDVDMIAEFGYEVLVETGRLWLEVGHYHEQTFRIDDVTGPDEYTAIVNNNYYTNAMAQYHMGWIVKLYDVLKEKDTTLMDRLGLTAKEILAFQKAATNMFLPFDDALNIHKQDDSFLAKKVWDFENTPKKKYPLLLNYHPLKIYRHQVLKQADTVLGHFLLDQNNYEILKDSFHYYEKITTHDSSLSPCVYGMMASRVGEHQKAYEYFMKTIYLDIDNLHGNTKDGLHIANAGGSFLAIVYGFAGLRITEQGIKLRPSKPNEWQDYSFRFTYRGHLIMIHISEVIRIESDEKINLFINELEYEVDGVLEVEYHGC